jgi:hypothetical protein
MRIHATRSRDAPRASGWRLTLLCASCAGVWVRTGGALQYADFPIAFHAGGRDFAELGDAVFTELPVKLLVGDHLTNEPGDDRRRIDAHYLSHPTLSELMKEAVLDACGCVLNT